MRHEVSNETGLCQHSWRVSFRFGQLQTVSRQRNGVHGSVGIVVINVLLFNDAIYFRD